MIADTGFGALGATFSNTQRAIRNSFGAGFLNTDRNFDDLAEHFARKVYGGLKGEIRLAVIWRDLCQSLPQIETGNPMRVLDVGAGMGQIALRLAALGHRVTVNDVSQEMLTKARQAAREKGLEDKVKWCHCPYQALQQSIEGDFDLVLCHALLEWLSEPETLIPALTRFMAPHGTLSLTFYNRHGLVYRNLIRGNFKLLDSEFIADSGSLTPGNPLLPETVAGWLADNKLSVEASTGIRVFNDYVTSQRGGLENPAAVVAKELEYSRQAPYKWLGRYLHYLCHR